MRAVIFEPDFSGHRLHHVRLIAEALLDAGHDVEIVLSTEAKASAEFGVHLESIPWKLRLVETQPTHGKGPWVNAGQRLQSLASVLHKLEPDHVYIPYGDGMTQRGAIERFYRTNRFPTKPFIEVGHHRGHFAYRAGDLRSRIHGRLSRALIKSAPWDFLHLQDPLAYEYLAHRQRGGSREPRLDLIPDPVAPHSEDHHTARVRLGLDPDAQYVGCIGLIDSRKGIDRLLDAFDSGLGAGVRLLLFGRHDPEIRSALQSRFASHLQAGTIVSRDEYLSEEVFDSAIAACDVIALPYREHPGSSGVLHRAAGAGRPVVTSDYGWMGECVDRFGLGVTCDVGDTRVLSSTITSLLAHEKRFALSDRGRRWMEFNSVENFKTVWMQQIGIRSGSADGRSPRTWEWVMGF